jgi:hypothetical protein
MHLFLPYCFICNRLNMPALLCHFP